MPTVSMSTIKLKRLYIDAIKTRLKPNKHPENNILWEEFDTALLKMTARELETFESIIDGFRREIMIEKT